MNKKLVLYLFLVISVIIILFNLPERSSQEEYYKNIRDKVNYQNYNGVIVKKYIDQDNARRKIDIKLVNKKIHTIDLYYEKKEFFEFFKVGDSLVKNSGSFKLRVKRTGLDTTLVFNLLNIKGFEKFRSTKSD